MLNLLPDCPIAPHFFSIFRICDGTQDTGAWEDATDRTEADRELLASRTHAQFNPFRNIVKYFRQRDVLVFAGSSIDSTGGSGRRGPSHREPAIADLEQ